MTNPWKTRADRLKRTRNARPGPDWQTAEEVAAALGVTVEHGRREARRLVAAGQAEIRRGMRVTDGRVAPCCYYRLVKAPA